MDDLHVDIMIIGAGPAGLSAAIRLAQGYREKNKEFQIVVLEKGARVGAHIVSGAVLETRALDELLPDWKTRNPPPMTPVSSERFCWLTRQRSWTLPTPPTLRNTNHYLISLGALCTWLAQEAQTLGVQIFPGFTGAELLLSDDKKIVQGVLTGAMGLDKNGQPTERYQAGTRIYAQHTLLAEGCHGSLTQAAIRHFSLRHQDTPQTYGLGLKEIWDIDPQHHQLGKVLHTVGCPLDTHTYGGGFLYHIPPTRIALGMVVGLDYTNPYLDPFQELQRLKTHPAIAPLLQGGTRIAYGARALNEGGLQSLPTLQFPGGMILGCAAGFLNVAKLKGIHTAMKSGMVAADTLLHPAGADYTTNLRNSWLWKELYQARNIRPGFRYGLLGGLTHAALDTYLLRGHAPWTLQHHTADHQCLQKSKNCVKISYPPPDNRLTFDKASSVHLTQVQHAEGQPCHLQLIDPERAITHNLRHYDAPETRYCPAGVYEIIHQGGQPQLHIHAEQCIHCKTCDIKDPGQNIHWATPQGGDGPNYEEL